MSAYPVTFESEYVEPRNRLTSFFRLIMVIPHVIVYYVYTLIADLAAIAAWFAIVFTGNYPPGLYNFVAGYTRWTAQFGGYATLMTDEYPPFWGNVEDGYPIRVRFAGPLPKYNRLKTGFRIIIGLPLLMFVSAVVQILQFAAFGAWWVILFTGRQPKGLQDALSVSLSYVVRAHAYLLLLTETYPGFLDDDLEAATGAGPSPTLPSSAATPPPVPEKPVGAPAGAGGPESPAGPQSPGGPQSPSGS